MNILTWNIRGMNAPRKRHILHDMILHNNIDMVAIQETKKEEFSLRMLNSLSHKLDIWIYAPAIGTAGGILFGGDSNKISILSHSKHKFCLDIHLQNKLDNTTWQFTIVYGPTIRNLKRELWAELELIRQGQQQPWILCGDFNVIRTQQEKSGPAFDVKISKLFNSFINRHHLVEHKLHNRQYTWSNGRQFALLDRFFTTLDWDQLYPNSLVTDLGKTGSDHNP